MDDQLVISTGPTGAAPVQDIDTTPIGTGEILTATIAGVPLWLIVTIAVAAVYVAKKKRLIS
jgi:hypothetical protein